VRCSMRCCARSLNSGSTSSTQILPEARQRRDPHDIADGFTVDETPFGPLFHCVACELPADQ
jgi:hypothetical protein